MDLQSLKTYTTRYKDDDGIERAVLLWEHYEQLLRMADKQQPNPDECLAAGYCMGLAHRDGNYLTEVDRKMLKTVGRCIHRIINGEPPE